MWKCTFMTTLLRPHNYKKKLHLLDIFATLTTKTGTKIVPTLAKSTILTSRLKTFHKLIYGCPNKVRRGGRGEIFRKVISASPHMGGPILAFETLEQAIIFVDGSWPLPRHYGVFRDCLAILFGTFLQTHLSNTYTPKKKGIKI